MPFEEYQDTIIKTLKNEYHIKSWYIDCLQDDIKLSYERSKRVSELLGSDQIDPQGYCFGISMLYPEFPPVYSKK